ncbi:MAG: hypothetical protein IIT78_03260 [Mycoplasmataceae bacterium]|nr:hypothetical protein [Mycoplasmataceae bacterium]
MKKSIKLTLGLLGISAISAITVGSVISCSNNNSNLASNNNQDNKNSNNKSSSTNPNSSNDTNFIPYSELTKMVTKEQNFTAALANWTQRWKQLTSNRETYLKMITNDFNACLSYTTEFFNAHSNIKDDWFLSRYGHNWIASQSYSNVQISLNKNNSFDISYDCTDYIGYTNDKHVYPKVIEVTSKNYYDNITFIPFLYNLIPPRNDLNSTPLYYSGCYSNSGTYTYIPTVTILSESDFKTAPAEVFNFILPSENTQWINYIKEISNTNLSNTGCSAYGSGGPFGIMWCHIISRLFDYGLLYLISSYQNGINYGELSSPINRSYSGN